MYLITKDGQKEYVKPYSANWFPVPQLVVQTNRDIDNNLGLTGNRRTKHRTNYLDIPVFLDAETSHDKNNTVAWIHQWAAVWNHQFIVGRYVTEITQVFDKLDEIAHGNRYKNGHKTNIPYIIVYVHNLSYDLVYMERFLPNLEVFATAPHKPLYARYKHVEIRCSYRLTGKSLAKWAKDSNSRYPKLADYDYDSIRTPADDLTEQEWSYQLNDVAAMESAWNNDRANDGFITAALPLTSTGFVRLDMRLRAYANNYISTRKHLSPTYDQYNAERAAFMGGYTHGNRFLKCRTLSAPGGIGHRDFRSRYPASMCTARFPMGKWKEADEPTTDFLQFLIRGKKCCLFKILMQDMRLKDRAITAPYLGFSKLFDTVFDDRLIDNGRIIYFKGFASMWVTEIDYKWIIEQYDGNIKIETLYYCESGMLPAWYRAAIMEYFFDKTTKKNSDFATYMLSKAKLNGIYGQSVQSWIQAITEYANGIYTDGVGDPEQLFDKYSRSEKVFSLYSWGVWTTANSRDELFKCIIAIGYENYIYSDTDSIFYFITPETERAIAEYNRNTITLADSCGAAVDYNGEHYALGEFTPEDDMPIRKFRFVHSKCYALIDKDGEFHVTIAGVNKVNKSTGTTNAQELQTIDNLAPGFIFHECGGHRIEYIIDEPHTITVNGCTIPVANSAIIIPTEYMVNDTGRIDYDDEYQLQIIAGMYQTDNDGGWIMNNSPRG